MFLIQSNMKIIIVLFIAVYSSQAILTEKWDHFKRSHRRQFANSREERFRKGIFQKKSQHIDEHNEKFRKGLETYEIGVNQFTDYTEEEIEQYTHGFQLPSEMPEPLINISSRDSLGIKEWQALPASFDWRTKGIVIKVKDQKSCGSCWAFSSTGALEAHYQIHHGSNLSISLSEQQLVDCDKASHGCSGGNMYNAFKYVAANGGISYDSDYRYEAKDEACRYQSTKAHIACKGYAILSSDENLLKDVIVTQGPISIAIDARGNFGSYKSGVYYNPSCFTTSSTHAVVIVGYGNEDGQDYWLVKNSWGPNWGQNGYIKMARNRDNNCGIATYPIYPVF